MGQLPATVKTIKVHPAIGIARLSTIPEGGDYYFVFGTKPATYKFNGLMKRQAVQFRLFAYAANNQAVEELTPNLLAQNGIDVVWTVTVGNSKIPTGLGGDATEILQATASSNQNNGRLVATMPHFDEGQSIPLGQITPTGLFIPPQAGVFRRHAGQPIQGGFPGSTDYCDNICDGLVTVQLTDQNTGQPIAITTLGAWVAVAPQDFRPDTTDADLNPIQPTLEDYFKKRLSLAFNPPTNPLNKTAWTVDHESLRPCTAIFSPGIETNLTSFENNGGLVGTLLYDAATTGDPEEVRIRPDLSGTGTGVAPGMLTGQLCSPWQFDFMACTCGYWAAQRPDTLFKSANSNDLIRWLRKQVNDPSGAVGGVISSSRELIQYVDQLGVGRRNGAHDVETERTKDIP